MINHGQLTWVVESRLVLSKGWAEVVVVVVVAEEFVVALVVGGIAGGGPDPGVTTVVVVVVTGGVAVVGGGAVGDEGAAAVTGVEVHPGDVGGGVMEAVSDIVGGGSAVVIPVSVVVGSVRITGALSEAVEEVEGLWSSL